MKKEIEPLASEALYQQCNPDDFGFKTTAELEDIDVIAGQQRAYEALQFGIHIKGSGYNLFALGPPDTGTFPTGMAVYHAFLN